MSDRTDIKTWQGRIDLAHDQQWLSERMKVRQKLTKWTESRFWGTLAVLQSEFDIKKREVNWGAAYIRALQAMLYSQNPMTTVSTPGYPPELRECLGELATNLLTETSFRKVVKPIISDAGLGGYGFCQVGYEPVLGWSGTREKQHRMKAQEQIAGIMEGRLGTVDDSQDHRIYMEEIRSAIEFWTSMYGPQAPVVRDAISLLARHKEASLKQRVSPAQVIEDRSLWAVRIEPVIGKHHQVLWELDAPLDSADWVAIEWRLPLEKVKATPYYSNTDDLQPSSTLNRRGDYDEEEARELYGDEFVRDVQMVRGWDVFDRAQGRKIVIADGHQEFLLNEKYAMGDVLRSCGLRWLTFKPNTNPSRLGNTPLEDAASQIAIINHCEYYLALVLEKRVPGLIYDKRGVSDKDAARIAQMEGGEQLGIEPTGDRPINQLFAPTPAIQGPADALEALYRAEAQMALILGLGDTSLGQTEKSRTATASSMNDEAQGDRVGELSALTEAFVSDVQEDMLQLAKRYFDRETVGMLVGPRLAQFWPEPWPEKFAKRREWVRVDAGSSLPGRKEMEMRKAMEVFGILSGHPAVQQVELLKWFTEKTGVPDKVVIPEQIEQQLAMGQPTTSQKLIGGPETVASLPGGPQNMGGQAVSPDTAMRQKAGQLGQAAKQRQ